MRKHQKFEDIKMKTVAEVLETDFSAQSFKLTDLGNSERLVAKYKDIIRYNEDRRKWLVWNKKVWMTDENNARIMTLAKRVVRDMLKEAARIDDTEQRRSLIKHSFKSESERSFRAMIFLAQSNKSIIVHNRQLDNDLFLLNCKNGTLNLITGELMLHNKDNLITKMIPFDYEPNAVCPLWDNFLNEITNNDPKLIQYLANAVGYSLTGSTKSQVLFFLYGLGNNGKTTFINIIRYLMADYGGTTSIDLFLTKYRSGSSRESLANLQGKRFVSSSEIEAGKELSVTIIKNITGEDMIVADRKYEHEVEFSPTHKIWISGNHKPQIKDTGHAIWRRIKIIPFLVIIPNEKIDKNLTEKLKKEMSGILNWALKGCLNWYKNGFEEPEIIQEAIQKYRKEEDILADYLDDCCSLGKDKKISKKSLYLDYKEWCEKEGASFILSQKMFGIRLIERGITDGRSGNVRYWIGLDINHSVIKENEINVSEIGLEE